MAFVFVEMTLSTSDIITGELEPKLRHILKVLGRDVD